MSEQTPVTLLRALVEEAEEEWGGLTNREKRAAFRDAVNYGLAIEAEARAQPDLAALRAATTLVAFAHRHLLGDSDVTREDASGALVEVERTLRALLSATEPVA